jgi:hypothetical protein
VTGGDRGTLPAVSPPPEGVRWNPSRGDPKPDRAVRGILVEQGDDYGHRRQSEEQRGHRMSRHWVARNRACRREAKSSPAMRRAKQLESSR